MNGNGLRGVAVLPDWLVREEGAGLPIRAVRCGEDGVEYIAGFLALARETGR